jgi:hypothetical protein
MLRRALAILLIVPVFAPAVQAQPEQPEWTWQHLDLRRVAGLSLVWTERPGAGQCGSAQSFREQLTDRLGYSPFGSPSPVHPTIVLALRRLDLSITRTKSHLTATVSGFDDNGEPLFDPRSITLPRHQCEQLRGLVVAMAVDTIRSFIPPLPKADPPAPVKLPAAVPKAAAPPRHETLADDPRVGAAWTVGLDVGTAPNPMVSMSYHGILRWPDFSLTLEFQVLAAPEGVGEHDVRAYSWAGALAPCAYRGVLFGCGLAAFGVRSFETGYTESGKPVEPDVRNPLFAAIGLRVGAAWPPRPESGGSVRVLVDLLHTPLPTTLIVRGDEVWSSLPIVGRFSLGFEQLF